MTGTIVYQEKRDTKTQTQKQNRFPTMKVLLLFSWQLAIFSPCLKIYGDILISCQNSSTSEFENCAFSLPCWRHKISVVSSNQLQLSSSLSSLHTWGLSANNVSLWWCLWVWEYDKMIESNGGMMCWLLWCTKWYQWENSCWTVSEWKTNNQTKIY